MYQNYIFDLYGTLVDIKTDEEKEEVWEKLRLFYGYYGAVYEPEELKASYEKLIKDKTGKDRTEYADKACEACPEIRIDEVFSELFAIKEVRAENGLAVYAGQFFRALSTDHIRLYEGAQRMLQRLRKRGKKLYLLSNAQRIFTAYEMELLKITGYFDGIILSSDYGIKKPEKQIFEELIAQYHLEPGESIMIGNDEICDIAGAQQVGMDTCYVHSGISPEYTGKVKPTYKVAEPDFKKIYGMISG